MREAFSRVLTDPAARSILRYMGVRGLVKTVYQSAYHTDSLSKLVVGPQVDVEISRRATVNIDTHLVFGAKHYGASHVDLMGSKLAIDDGATLSITATEGGAFVGPGSVVHVEGQLVMGSSFINSHVRIICEESITIGNGCVIAWNVQFVDSDRHQLFLDGEPVERAAPIHVEDGVWIGHDVTIKKGVTVGEGAVVASNSVVTDDVPPTTLVAGSPAKVISEEVFWER